jgi:hypothetical protein
MMREVLGGHELGSWPGGCGVLAGGWPGERLAERGGSLLRGAEVACWAALVERAGACASWSLGRCVGNVDQQERSRAGRL